MHLIIFFPENLKKNLGFTGEFSKGRVTLNTGICYLALLALINISKDLSLYNEIRMVHCIY